MMQGLGCDWRGVAWHGVAWHGVVWLGLPAMCAMNAAGNPPQLARGDLAP
jgi:hypothetical protein